MLVYVEFIGDLCMGKNFYLYFLLLCFCVPGLAQKVNKDSLLDEHLYRKNIGIYKNILKSGPNKEVSLKLAEALRHIGSYKQAAVEYAKAMDRPDLNPIYYKNYSEVLAQIGQKEESERWSLRYKEYTKRADKISDAHVHIDTGAHFINRSAFNSLETDFGPTLYKDGILFVSAFSPENKQTVHVGTGESLYEFFYAERNKSGGFKNPVQVFKGINTAEYEGPVGFNTSFDTLFFMKSNLDQLKAKTKDKSIKMQLVQGAVVNDEIIDIRPLEFNDGIHSFSCPSLSPDGKELYFVANMDSVNGSIDIYVSHRSNGKWGKPQSLGPIVNSAEDEMYPFLSKNGKLYFSSLRPGGLGGLDIYVTEKKDGKWTSPSHLPAPVNSIFDDFSYVESTGTGESYFASNRAESLGSDDIFSCHNLFHADSDQTRFQYRMITLINKDNFISQDGNKIKGFLRPNSDTVSFHGTVVQLLDKDKRIVRRCYVAKDGYFSFSNLAPDNYLIVYENQRENAVAEVYIANKNPEFLDPEDVQKYKIGTVHKDSLSIDKANFVVGTLLSSSPEHAKEGAASLLLVKEDGRIVKRVKANTNSYFVFKNLPSDQFFVVTEDNNPYYQCLVQYANVDKTVKVFDREWFKFRKLGIDSLQQDKVIVHGRIKDNYSGESDIFLLDSNDRVVQKTEANKDGYFVFRNLGREDLWMAVANHNPYVSVEYSTIYQGEDSVYQVFKSNILQKLARSEDSIGQKMVMNGRLTSEGKPLQDRLILLVDKENKVITQAHSNVDGFFAFKKLKPDDFYMVVQENEKPYVLEKTFSLEDTSLMIRELEFHKFQKKKDSFFAIKGTAYNKTDHSPAKSKLMLLTDTNGNVIRQTWVSDNGTFTFTNLQPDNYIVLFQQYDPAQAAEVKLTQDAATRLVQVENGKTVTYSLPIVHEENRTIIFFSTRSDIVDKKYRKELSKVIAAFKDTTIKKIEVHGYADLSGNAEYNLSLSERRAHNCILALKELAGKNRDIEIAEVPEGATDRFHNTYGAYLPALNRRVEIILR